MILIVDDSKDTRESIRSLLLSAGLYTCGTGYSAAADSVTDGIDFAVVMPGCRYFTVGDMCEKLKSSFPAMAVISVIPGSNDTDTKKAQRYSDRQLYLPLSNEAFISALSSLCSSSRLDIHMGELHLCLPKYEAFACGKPLFLTRTEFRLLHFLACEKGRCYKGSRLLGYCFCGHEMIGGGNVPTHISVINKKARLACGRPVIINLRGQGYTVSYDFR